MRESASNCPIDITAVISTLHEQPGRCSAERLFRNEPVLAWTLRRLARSGSVARVAVLCWEDQQPQVGTIAAGLGAFCSVRSPRIKIPQIESVAAARRWADGWRGGLLATCEFDRGFHGPWIEEIRQKVGGDAILLIDPAAALVDGALIDTMVNHAVGNPEVDFFFSQAAPGLSGILIRKSMLDRLAALRTHPGTVLAYRPDLPFQDPISSLACAPVPTSVARSTLRFTLDSARQVDRISNATHHLNGELTSTEAETLVHSLSIAPPTKMPREISLELTTRRVARPIYWPGSTLAINRDDMPMEMACKLIDELRAVDDARIYLAGVGDPLLHPGVLDIIDRAQKVGISVGLETDLLNVETETIDRLVDSGADIISVNIPAITAHTYAQVMGIDGVKTVMTNLQRLSDRKQMLDCGTPLLVPTFVKTNVNLAEMEPWYDHWLRKLGSAVINGPSDFAGQIADVSAAQMEPPRRRACARIAQRLTILSDGRMVSCEQDVLGKQPLGQIGKDSIASVWSGTSATLRANHAAENWNKHSLCAACRDWHRP